MIMMIWSTTIAKGKAALPPPLSFMMSTKPTMARKPRNKLLPSLTWKSKIPVAIKPLRKKRSQMSRTSHAICLGLTEISLNLPLSGVILNSLP